MFWKWRMKKRTKTIGEIFDSPEVDAAAKRAVIRAIRENAALDRLRKVEKSRGKGKSRKRAA